MIDCLYGDAACRPRQPNVIPVLRSLVPIPDDVVETSDDDEDAANFPSTSHLSHQPRPFAVCSLSAFIHAYNCIVFNVK